jgi:predicted permease
MVGRSRATLLLLLAASAVLLLIACANVINLMVARMATRQGEIALRLAIGAARIRLVQQCLAESLLLALAAGAIGVTLALVGVKALVALSPGNVPRVEEIGVDGAVLAFAIGISVLVAIVLGLVTAWRGTHADLRSALSQAQRTHSGAGSTEQLRRTLVVAQVALTLVLLISAGLLGRSFIRLITVDPGFRTGGAVVLDMSVPAEGKDAIESRARLYEDIIQRIAAMPGVTNVGGINALPLDGSGANGTFIILSGPGDLLNRANSLTIEEMSAEERTDFFAAFSSRSNDPAQSGDAQFRVVSENYFQTMGIPLVAGRLFDSRDTRTAPSAAVISQSLARAKWPGEDPLGKLIQYGNMDGDLRPYTVVGVVADVRDANLESAPRPTFYGLFRQRPDSAQGLNLVITSDGDLAPVIASARRMVRELRPDVPAQFRTMESIVARSMGSRSFILTLVAVFGGAALLLAGLGVYSVIAYLVTQREREISIRVALGARGQDIVQLVLRQGVMLAVAGIIVGAAGAVAATRLLAGFLYGTSPTDPVSFVAVIGLLAAVALLASYVPARRAARVEAMGSLRAG